MDKADIEKIRAKIDELKARRLTQPSFGVRKAKSKSKGVKIDKELWAQFMKEKKEKRDAAG